MSLPNETENKLTKWCSFITYEQNNAIPIREEILHKSTKNNLKNMSNTIKTFAHYTSLHIRLRCFQIQ